MNGIKESSSAINIDRSNMHEASEKNVSSDEVDDSEEDENLLEWEDIGKGKNIQLHKPNLNPQNQSTKMMEYQSVDKLFNKYADKINVDQYRFSDLKDLKLSDGDR